MLCSSSAAHQGCFPGSCCHSSPKAGSPPLTPVWQGRTQVLHQQAMGDEEGAGPAGVTVVGTMEDRSDNKRREWAKTDREHG